MPAWSAGNILPPLRFVAASRARARVNPNPPLASRALFAAGAMKRFARFFHNPLERAAMVESLSVVGLTYAAR